MSKVQGASAVTQQLANMRQRNTVGAESKSSAMAAKPDSSRGSQAD